MTIHAKRITRLIGTPERTNDWEPFAYRTAIETVVRDPRPARAVAAYTLIAIAAGIGGWYLGDIAQAITSLSAWFF